MIICSSPACQTSAGCQCVGFVKHRQVPTYTAGGTGYVMPPLATWERQAASIICGSPFVKDIPNLDEFEIFIREVLRTTAPSRT
jgi:hypothetical protein